MTTIPGTTRAQTIFLRSFCNGAPPRWPSITILRRWLRRRAFRAALESLRETYRFQADFQLAAAAAQATAALASPAPTSPPPQDPAPDAQDSAPAPAFDIKIIERLLRLAHQRQRQPAEYDHLQSPARPGLYTDSDRFNLDPYNAKEGRWVTPHPRSRPRKRPTRASKPIEGAPSSPEHKPETITPTQTPTHPL